MTKRLRNGGSLNLAALLVCPTTVSTSGTCNWTVNGDHWSYRLYTTRLRTFEGAIEAKAERMEDERLSVFQH